jgi:hypothetical protein
MRLIALLVLGQITGIAHAADVYRSVTEDGTVVFGDRPFSANVDMVHVAVPAEGGPAVPITAAPARRPVVAGNQPTSADPASEQMTNAQIAQRIAENCDLAKRQLAVLESTDDLVRTAADGTMERLTPEEMVEVRETAAAEVAEWCEAPASAAGTP